jgi:hypothetical protein
MLYFNHRRIITTADIEWRVMAVLGYMRLSSVNPRLSSALKAPMYRAAISFSGICDRRRRRTTRHRQVMLKMIVLATQKGREEPKTLFFKQGKKQINGGDVHDLDNAAMDLRTEF